ENYLDVTFIPDVNPDSVPLQFPPREPAYATDWSSWSLWRWLETHSYDAVIIMGGDAFGFGEALASGASALGNVPVFEFDYEAELIDALKGQKQLRRSPASESMQLRMQRDETELAAELSSVYGQSV